jgi:hypothetical protein
MHHYVRVAVLVVGVILSVSCGGDGAVLAPSEPAPLAKAAPVVATTGRMISVEPVANAFCPSVSPFRVPVVVSVSASGPGTVTVTGFRLFFEDTAGRRGPQVTLPMPQATMPAPLPLGPGSSPQSFPLSLGIGCGTGTRGTIVIIVDTQDDAGRRRSDRVTVAVP